MKIAFISDIHGNAAALEAVLKDIEKKEVDKIYVLGDLCFRGPEPKRSIELVRQLDTDVIKGNADEWVVRGVKPGEVPEQSLEIMNRERDWTVSQLDQDSLDYLQNLPSALEAEFGHIKVQAFHATPDNLFDIVYPFEADESLMGKMMKNQADLYIYAHIHKPYIRFINGKCIMNIGSVGLPFDGVRKSSYGLLEVSDESWQTTIVRVNYDVNKTIEKLLESNYPNREQICNLLKSASN
ncbi:metallophosphoesterase family protein [Neobacillus muris]|uniref:metallophosphoesterase family protein n=1 Tax=Neobacillus muris TaxID=2941334 RepID=UPI00203F1715|nr:metallophosphoesterase family protein [Neobacillus muris]